MRPGPAFRLDNADGVIYNEGMASSILLNTFLLALGVLDGFLVPAMTLTVLLWLRRRR